MRRPAVRRLQLFGGLLLYQVRLQHHVLRRLRRSLRKTWRANPGQGLNMHFNKATLDNNLQVKIGQKIFFFKFNCVKESIESFQVVDLEKKYWKCENRSETKFK